MAEVTFASKLKNDGSLTIPSEAVDELGLHPGDEVKVRVELTNGVVSDDEEQAILQAKFDRFFERLDTFTFEKPTPLLNGDAAETAFTEAMDEKYRKLGFKP